MVSAGQNPPVGRPPEKGERAADVPTFFKKKGLVPEFDQFLRRSGPGHFVEPTLLADVKPTMRVVRTHRRPDDNPALRLLSSGCSTPPAVACSSVQGPASADGRC